MLALPYCIESTGDVLVGQGGVDHPRGKGGGGEEGGDDEDGGGDEKALLHQMPIFGFGCILWSI